MDEYFDGCNKLYGKDVKDKATTPSKGDLFDEDNRDDAMTLSTITAGKFHHTIATLLCVAKRVRINIDLAVSFLCTRVASPTREDEIKLKQVLPYLNGTKRMRGTLWMNGMHCIQT